jgi:hypothetical protein
MFWAAPQQPLSGPANAKARDGYFTAILRPKSIDNGRFHIYTAVGGENAKAFKRV